ncbi:hypothetical protein [Paenibacillus thermotolerans]|uniref:hypothetical protein n=1 Tax=Paenibacillus thermotolerans TaxID=3027807 RepID=UPI0023683517|nr:MULTISPECIES: hypothetical protein [unclassified Paenibacillus]
MAGKKIRSRDVPAHNKNQLYMKIVTSDTCSVCKQQCARGIRYMEQMEQPGAVGNGVPCILTAYKMHS